MDRLTVKTKHSAIIQDHAIKGKKLRDAIRKLADYEDTGLEPSEIVDRKEMFKAYRHVCGGHSPEEVRAALDELSAYRELGTVEELTAIKAFAERAKRDYTECDKMFIHISELDKALKETTHENN